MDACDGGQDYDAATYDDDDSGDDDGKMTDKNATLFKGAASLPSSSGSGHSTLSQS